MSRVFVRVLIAYDIENWAYWRRAMQLAKHAPSDVEVTTCAWADVPWGDLKNGRFDVFFVLDYAQSRGVRRRLGESVPIVVSFNKDENSRHDERRLTLKYADVVICNNFSVWDYIKCHEYAHFHKCVCISNGVDMDTFRPVVPIDQRPPRALWTGSSGKSKTKRYHELLMPLACELFHRGIESDFRPINQVTGNPHVMATEAMVDWYNSGSVVVCASESEGTPNFLSEGLACGCVPVSTYVANIKEYGADRVNCLICEPTVDAFVEGVTYALANKSQLAEAARQTFVRGGWNWAERSQYFYQLFRLIARRGVKAVKPFSYMDCSHDEIYQ